MDATERMVWIDAEPAVDPSRAGALCRRHADALRPPRGWTLDDRRDEMPKLLRVPENRGSEPTRPSAPRPQRQRRATEMSAPDLFSDPAPLEPVSGRPAVNGVADPLPAAEIRPETINPVEITSDTADPDMPTHDETKAIPWVPRLGGGIPDDVPRGRLLGRAFGRREPEGN